MQLKDDLTGLFNRDYFNEIIGQEIERSRRSGINLGVLLVRIDDLDASHGVKHAKADEVVVEMARVIRANVRETDIIFRWEPHGFLVLMFDANGDSVEQKAVFLRAKIQEFNASEAAFSSPVSVSIGCSAHQPGEEFARAILTAEGALSAV